MMLNKINNKNGDLILKIKETIGGKIKKIFIKTKQIWPSILNLVKF